MPECKASDYSEWIWIPFGFAHGNIFTEETRIEYYCSGEYNPKCEAGICPLSNDIDWSLCYEKLKNIYLSLKEQFLISEKDRNGLSLSDWKNDERAKFFAL